MPRRQLISSDQAVPAKRQHTAPCDDCPWSRMALAGWLGPGTVDEWLATAHGDARIDCHTLVGAQCAGGAIYRANVCKLPRDPSQLRLPANRDRVFSSPAEFVQHHRGGGPKRWVEGKGWQTMILGPVGQAQRKRPRSKKKT